MPQYRSKTSTGGRNQAGARALWRATGMTDGDFEKPIIAAGWRFFAFLDKRVPRTAIIAFSGPFWRNSPALLANE